MYPVSVSACSQKNSELFRYKTKLYEAGDRNERSDYSFVLFSPHFLTFTQWPQTDSDYDMSALFTKERKKIYYMKSLSFNTSTISPRLFFARTTKKDLHHSLL